MPVTTKHLGPPVQDSLANLGDYLTRKEVLAFLGVKPQTLYTYVSRGFIRSIPRPDGRTSYYPREDVLRMRAKSIARSGHGPAAASAMRWGEPIMETSITELTDHGPRYRGRLALDLARQGHSFESVAEFLWGGELAEEPASWRDLRLPRNFPAFLRESAALRDHPHFLQLLAAAIVALGIAEGSRRDRILAGSTPVQTGRRLIRSLVGVFGFLNPKEPGYCAVADRDSISQGLLRMVGLRAGREQVRAVNAALILVADHELNPATFVARIAASSGSDMHSCVGAAINTHYSSQIGRACDRVEQIFSADVTPDGVVAQAKELRVLGRKLPGFDHRLYPHGDPRAEALIEIAKSTGGARIKHILQALDRVHAELGARPAVESGLGVMCRALGIPNGGAAGLYAFGRSSGWIAHLMEQRDAGFMIRPRAKFANAETDDICSDPAPVAPAKRP